MHPSAANVKQLYGETLPPAYDDRPLSFPHRVLRAAKMVVGNRLYDFHTQAIRAIEAAGLARGDRVLVFCCGTGREFAAIRERIGAEGSILGVDFSAAMLARARYSIEREGWTNITLLEADVTEFESAGRAPFDVGFCTLGMSIIPDWAAAFDGLLSAVRPGGGVVVGDLQLTTGVRALLNPLVSWWTRPYGGSLRGHANTRELFARMERELDVVATGEDGHGTYRFCAARKP
ncbi:MAG: class I SAM-dependent methyltransferase [Planctomycetes bacterium]|nr:class I SAM-dependent methyltransferase [Planctomycetota bacterium]MCB9868577.1 class I SAM-dependent methyltransferase [Planctomycetota bacterium]